MHRASDTTQSTTGQNTAICIVVLDGEARITTLEVLATRERSKWIEHVVSTDHDVVYRTIGFYVSLVVCDHVPLNRNVRSTRNQHAVVIVTAASAGTFNVNVTVIDIDPGTMVDIYGVAGAGPNVAVFKGYIAYAVRIDAGTAGCADPIVREGFPDVGTGKSQCGSQRRYRP
jgi:hypothetical protein